MKDFKFTSVQFLDFLAEKEYLKLCEFPADPQSYWGFRTSLSNLDFYTFLYEEFNLSEKYAGYPEFIPDSWDFHSFGDGKITTVQYAESSYTDFFIDLKPLIKQLISNNGNVYKEDGTYEIYYEVEAHINDDENNNSLSIGVVVDDVDIDFSPQQEAEILEFIIESFKDKAYHYEFTEYPSSLHLQETHSLYRITTESTETYEEFLSDLALQDTVWVFDEKDLFDAGAKIRFTPSELDV